MITNTTDPIDEHIREIMVTFGKTVKKARKARGLTGKVLSMQLGITEGNMSDIQNGKRTLTVKSMLQICEKLNIRPVIRFIGTK